ncbi:MAG TPA: hypothetical protein VMV81_11820 [Phycisphaerae bacterium]|nr:hypothetical protein [Phycisphaerae bacterium]
MFHNRTLRAFFPALLAILVCTGFALAGAHTWRVNELFSDSTGTIQFIELRESGGGNGEVGVNGHSVTSNTRNYVIPGPSLPPVTGNRILLFATPAAAALPGMPTPDYVFPSNMVPFINPAGDTIQYFGFSSETFGAGQLPTDGVHSLTTYLGTRSVNCATPTNFNNVSGHINLGCTLLGDVDNNGSRNGNDISAFVRVVLGTPQLTDNATCAEYCTGTLSGNIAAFVNDLLS